MSVVPFEILSVVDLYPLSVPLPAAKNQKPETVAIQVPSKKIATTDGRLVLAFYQPIQMSSIYHMVIVREQEGFIFDYYFHENDKVQVWNEGFSLSEEEKQELGNFLASNTYS